MKDLAEELYLAVSRQGRLSSRGQQDAAEAFRSIMELIELARDDAHKGLRSLLRTASPPSSSPALPCVAPWETESFQELPFSGFEGSDIMCTFCQQNRPVVLEKFLVVTLPVQPRSSLLTLLAALRAPHSLTDVKCFRCTILEALEQYAVAIKEGAIPAPDVERVLRDASLRGDSPFVTAQADEDSWIDFLERCYYDQGVDVSTFADGMLIPLPETRRTFVRMDVLHRLPRLLCIQLGRLAFIGETTKVADFVPFPTVLPAVHVHGTKDSLGHYVLRGVVEHIGGSSGGHYVAYVSGRGDDEGSWYRTSDDSVERVPEGVVLRAFAYMLYYEKVITE